MRWTVVLAANGYPGTPKKGTEIRGLDKAAALPGVVITQAGTKREGAHLLADWRPGAERHRSRRDACRGAGPGPTQPSMRSTGPAASAAETSVGGRSRANSQIQKNMQQNGCVSPHFGILKGNHEVAHV